jgi:hypothetical protein
VIVHANSSPPITLTRVQYFELLHEFYCEVIVSREVHDEVTVAGAGRRGDAQRASDLDSSPAEPLDHELLPVTIANLTGSSIALASDQSLNAVYPLVYASADFPQRFCLRATFAQEIDRKYDHQPYVNKCRPIIGHLGHKNLEHCRHLVCEWPVSPNLLKYQSGREK